MPDAVVESVYRVTKLVCTALFGIVGLMTFVIWFMMRNGGLEREALEPSFYLVFTLVGLAGLAAGPYLRARVLRAGAAGRYVPNQNGVLAAVPPQDPRMARISALSPAAVIGQACGEPATLAGFVLSFMSGSWMPLAIGGSVTIAYMLWMFPYRSRWDRWVEQVGLGTAGVVPVTQPPAPL